MQLVFIVRYTHPGSRSQLKRLNRFISLDLNIFSNLSRKINLEIVCDTLLPREKILKRDRYTKEVLQSYTVIKNENLKKVFTIAKFSSCKDM